MEASIRLFKKDDPTFEFNQLDKIRRWRAYVASYMAVEPTEELDYSRLRYPYLKNRLSKIEDLGEDDRFEQIKSVDRITVQIHPQMYTMKFIATEPYGTGGVQYFSQIDPSTSNNTTEEDSSAQVQSRTERAQELFVRNNVWMKDLSRDEVEARKVAFQDLMKQPRPVENDGDDVEMADS